MTKSGAANGLSCENSITGNVSSVGVMLGVVKYITEQWEYS